jgi:hypothetical protein
MSWEGICRFEIFSYSFIPYSLTTTLAPGQHPYVPISYIISALAGGNVNSPSTVARTRK